MCGITGLLHFDGQQVDQAVLDRMTDVLVHRGPDGRGTHVDGSLGLGHRRLSIIDLSDDAAQPMSNEDGSVWVVLNGEIYNFQALREELLAKGHTFRSHSDTEVLVHLYEEEGEALVERLRGMFAFAIWDAKQKRLVLARDRFGQKPLYYRLGETSFHFGSEAKALLADPAVPRQPNLDAIHDFLTYCYVPGPASGFLGIDRLPPGHLLTVEADGSHRLKRYWQLSLAPKRPLGSLGRAEVSRIEDDLLGLLDESVRLRMISDVPLGAFLSGGVDSSAIVASMCAVGGDPRAVRTFAIGFEEASYDESAFAARVADYLGTQHTGLVLSPDTFGGLERIVWHYGDPYADASCLPTFAVSKLASEQVTVALTGDGGDELFCGYSRYVAARLEERARKLRWPLRGLTRSPLVGEALRRAGQTELASFLGHNAYYRREPLNDVYISNLEYLNGAVKEQLYGDRLRPLLQRDSRDVVRRALNASDGETFTERCAHADASTYLPDDILVKVDVASMAHSLECRAPFLDHRLAEFVGRLPYELKMRHLRTKRILKDTLARRLPPEPLNRRKQGFGVPLEDWFRGRLDQLLKDVLLDPHALQRGYFREDALQRLVAEHTSGQADHRNVLFPLLMLETWHRVCVESSATEPAGQTG